VQADIIDNNDTVTAYQPSTHLLVD